MRAKLSPTVLIRFTLVILLFVGLAGCVLSLQPLYGDRDLVFEPALLGTWKPADDPVSWQCTQSGERAYRIVYTDEKGRRGEFSAHLMAIDGKRFLDLFPLPPPEPLNSFYTDHWIAGHTFARVVTVGKTLELAVLDQEWLKRFLREAPRAIRHEVVGDDIVLTAPTKELQRFLLAHLDTAGAFRPTLSLRRAS